MPETLFSQWRDMLIEIDEKIPGFITGTKHEVLISRISRMLQMYEITQHRLQKMYEDL